MNAQRTIAFIMISLESAVFGLMSETLFFSTSIVLLAALSYLPILQFACTRRQVFWTNIILALIFMVKFLISQHEFDLDQMAIRTPLAFAAAQFVMTIQLRQLFDGRFVPFLPNLFPILGIGTFILTGDILANDTSAVYYQVLAFSFVLFTGLFYQLGHAVREQKKKPKNNWSINVIRINFFGVIWLFAWLMATGLARYERQLDQLYYRLIEPDSSQITSRAGFSKISKLGSLIKQFDSGANQIKLRVESTDEPGYLRGRAFVQFFNSEWHSEIGNHNASLIAVPPAGIENDNLSEGSWFQIGEAKSSHWIEFKIWSEATGQLFAPLNTPLVHAMADSVQFDSQDILTSSSLENGYPYSLFFPRHQIPHRPESGLALQRLLQLPESISPEVKQLAKEIFAGCKNSSEKIKRIQKYFPENYQYESGISVPPRTDPLTYFLLEKPNAHCEYFASGTAILLRLADVPCRYVTGYIVRERNDYDQFWIARNRHAHAWVEAWDEQQGWVTVESTPAAGLPDNQTPGSIRQYWESFISQFTRIKMALNQGQWILAFSEAQLPLALLVCGVSLWFLFRWMFRICQKRLRERAAFQKKPLHIQELHYLLAQMDHLMSKHKLVRKPGETLMQFSRRIQSQEISDWYQAYASSRFMPESSITQELTVQLKRQLQEFRKLKKSL